MNALWTLLAQAAEHGEAAAGAVAEHGAAAAEHGGEVESPAEILLHHVTDHPLLADTHLFTKHLLFFVIAATLVLWIIRLAIRSYKKGGVPTGLGAAVESMVLFVRDDIAEANIGHDGRKFTPLLCSFFFFILVAALLGLVPFPWFADGHLVLVSATSTGGLSVTLALAAISFVAQQYAGISKYGVVGHFHNLVPPGIPKPLIPLMIIVELIGMFSKPFALMIRLFANMMAGHMVITALLLLIPIMAKVSMAFGVAMVPVSLGLSLFIMLLEILVAFIQAYIFTLLTAIFIGMYAHPAH
jgi:F-type H+-transporting ATPase subunit a